jgi:hypothetical protein
LAFFDVAAGANQPVHFPVPWADDASISFLESPEELKALLRAAGFRTLVWNDLTARAAKWYREQDKAPAGEVPVLDKTILAEDMPLKFANAARNVQEGRIRMLQAVAEKS